MVPSGPRGPQTVPGEQAAWTTRWPGAQGEGPKRRGLCPPAVAPLSGVARHPRESRSSHARQGSRRAARSSSRRLQTIWTAGQGPRSRHIIALPVADTCPPGGPDGRMGAGWQARFPCGGPGPLSGDRGLPAPARLSAGLGPRPPGPHPLALSLNGQGRRTAPCALTAVLVILPSKLARTVRNAVTPCTDAANTCFSKWSLKCNCGKMLHVALPGPGARAHRATPRLGGRLPVPGPRGDSRLFSWGLPPVGPRPLPLALLHLLLSRCPLTPGAAPSQGPRHVLEASAPAAFASASCTEVSSCYLLLVAR